MKGLGHFRMLRIPARSPPPEKEEASAIMAEGEKEKNEKDGGIKSSWEKCYQRSESIYSCRQAK